MSEAFTVPAGVKLLGEIVSWGFPLGQKVPYVAVLDALDAAGLDKTAARGMHPRNAFARACRELSDKRIIRLLGESAAEVRFQFTKEGKDADTDRLRYDFEAVLKLDKVTGEVRCDDCGELRERAQRAVDGAMATRDTGDLTTLINKLYARAADIFPVREQGGCYFVPAPHVGFTERVQAFITAVNGSLRRFPVPAGFPAGDKSVSEAVEEGLERAVGQHLQAIAEFSDATRESTLEKMVERINETRFKVESYGEYLLDARERVDRVLADARAKLRAKIAELGKGTAVPEPDGTVPPAPEPADEPAPVQPADDMAAELAAAYAEEAAAAPEPEPAAVAAAACVPSAAEFHAARAARRAERAAELDRMLAESWAE